MKKERAKIVHRRSNKKLPLNPSVIKSFFAAVAADKDIDEMKVVILADTEKNLVEAFGRYNQKEYPDGLPDRFKIVKVEAKNV